MSEKTIGRKRAFGNQSRGINLSDPNYIRNPPIGLMNSGFNNCFMNCALQVFYCIPSLRQRLNFCITNGMNSTTVTALHEIFEKMSSSNSLIFTANYFTLLKGNLKWKLGTQQDSNEFVIHVIQSLYTKKKTNENDVSNTKDLISNCPFNVTVKATFKCILPDCTRHSEKYTKNSTLLLTVNSQMTTSIQNLIDSQKHTETILDYDCKEKDDADHTHDCQGKQRMSTEDIFSVSEYVIVQLNIFGFNRSSKRQCKLQPSIEISKHITIAETNMELFAIVFHYGPSANAGHYTSAVLIQGNWFMTDDESIKPWTPNYFYDKKSYAFPYFAIYKRSENQDSNWNPSVSTLTVPDNVFHTPSELTHATYVHNWFLVKGAFATRRWL